jgi:nucleoid-associated protein EbfC
MFDGLKDMGKLMKQAKEMKSKMKDVQDELKKVIVKGTSRSGKVQVEMTGELDCRSVSIADDLLANKSQLESELVDAINSATKNSKDIATQKLSAITGGLNLPGM